MLTQPDEFLVHAGAQLIATTARECKVDESGLVKADWEKYDLFLFRLARGEYRLFEADGSFPFPLPKCSIGKWTFDCKTGRARYGKPNKEGNCFWVGPSEWGQLEAVKGNWPPSAFFQNLRRFSGTPLLVFSYDNVEAMRLIFQLHLLEQNSPLMVRYREAERLEGMVDAIRIALCEQLKK